MTGRAYGLVEEYRMEDAEAAVILMGSSAGTAKEAVNEMRSEGKKVGLVKIRSFRPFPKEEIIRALTGVKAFAAMDKNDSFSALSRPIYADTCAALYTSGIHPLALIFLRASAAGTSGWKASSMFSASF
jgi:pyruvate ferredoxin oxidoreductase alpha subunit